MLRKIILIFVILILLTSCSENITPTVIKNEVNKEIPKIKENKELNVGLEVFEIGNPLLIDTKSNKYLSSLIFDGLIDFDIKGNIIPKIAYKWEIKNDNTYIFYLNEGIKFHDGKLLTAYDVEFTYYTIAKLGNKSFEFNKIADIFGIGKFLGNETDKIEGIKVIDDYTISFKINEKNYYNIYDFDINILPKHVFKENENFKLIGSGPYKLSSINDNKIELEKFNDYYFKKPKIDKVNIIDLKKYNENDLDIVKVDIDSDYFNKFKDKDYKLLYNKDNSFSFIGLNINSQLFYDSKVRKALMYAIDRKNFIEKVYKGYGAICNYPDVINEYNLENYKYDKNKAKEILRKLNFKDIDNDGYLENKFNEKFEFNLLSYNTYYAKELSKLIVNNLKDIGIKVNVHYLSFEELINKVYEERRFDSFIMSYQMHISQNPIPIFSIEADIFDGLNVVSYYSEESDKIFSELKNEFDINKRKELFKSWIKLANNELPLLFISNKPEIWFVKENVKGFNPKPFYDFSSQIESIDINN